MGRLFEVSFSVEGGRRVADLWALAESSAGLEVWKLIFELVRNLNEVILQTLPSFWKVAKGYMEGKYQKVNLGCVNAPSAPLTRISLEQKNTSSSTATRRSPTQCRVMSQDIVTLYVSLLSAFFTLSSSTHSPPLALGAAPADPNATPPLPPFVPPNSNAAANCHWLLKTLNELTECVSELGALELAGEASASLKELVASTRWRFEEAICSSWVRGERS